MVRRRIAEQFRLLFAPPQDRDVLIADEQVFYKAPKHVMSLAEPTIETLAVLLVVTVILTRPTYDGINLGLLFLVLAALVVWKWLKERTWSYTSTGAAIITAYVFVTNSIDPLVLIPAVGVWFIARLGVKILRWWRYEVRYLTSRRIIEATGFLGLKVASMPVSRVTDLALHRTAWGEIFGYGSLRIESAGQDQSLANIPFLVEAGAFHRLSVRLATKPADISLNDFIDIRPVRQIERRA